MKSSLRFLAFLALPALSHAQTRYTITKLGPLDNSSLSSRAVAINASGTVVGWEDSVTSSARKSFAHSGGTISALPSLNFERNEPNAINASGTIVGSSRFPRDVGFIISGGVVTELADTSAANAINDAGTIAGSDAGGRPFSRSASGAVTVLTIPDPSGATVTGVVTAINASGTVVGYSRFTGAASRAFSARPGSSIDLGALPGSSPQWSSRAYGINAAGVMVGSSEVGLVTPHAVIFSGGAVTDIHPTTFTRSEALGINAAGTIVGYASSGSNQNQITRAFVYTPATRAVDLNTLVNNLAAAGFTSLFSATGINDTGQICGYGFVTNGDLRAFRLDPEGGASTAPTITTHPASQSVAAGGTATFSVAATGSPLSYEWRFNNAPIAGASAQTYSIASVAAASAGSYTVRVFNTAGSVTSNAATLTVTSAPPTAAARLINLSILTSLSGASDSFTMGYVVGGTGTSGAKPLVIRAAGPSLTALGVGGALADPRLELFAGATASGSNDNWGGGAALLTAMNNVGAFPLSGPTTLDAAVATSVAAGDNSVKVSPVGNISGQVIAEIYDATPDASFTAATPRLVNVSVLKNIGPSLTAGFVIGGTGSRTVLIRAIGPALAGFGVGGFVADPQLALFNSASAQIGANDNWGGTAALTAAFTSVAAFALPATSRDAALVSSLQPGNYTVQVSGVGGSTGTALVEIYEVP